MRVAILYDAAAERPEASADVSGVLEAVDAVDGALRLRGHEPRRVGVSRVHDRAWQEGIAACDAVFNLCESVAGVGSAEVDVARLIERTSRPLTGSRADALAQCRDKDRANSRLLDAGVPVPHWLRTDARDFRLSRWRAFPAIVKPAAEDASIGITQRSFARDADALEEALERAAAHAPLIVQRFVEGRELNVGVVGASVLPLAEIDFSGLPADAWRAVTYAAKWELGSTEDVGTLPRCPADLDEPIAGRARSVALEALRALGVTGYARVDLRVDERDEVWVVDVNPNPDLAPSAGLARMGRAAGWAYDELVGRILDEAVKGRTVQAVRPVVRWGGEGVFGGGDEGVADGRAAGPRHSPTPTTEDPGTRPHFDVVLRAPTRDHVDAIRTLLESTAVFRAEELDVALSVIESYLENPGQEYDVVGAFTHDDRLLGYACYGATPCTVGTWDLYWIAVSPDAQGQGIGKLIMQEVERRLTRADARLVLIETSSSQAYAPTRAFYRARGYTEVARVPDFYLDGDDRVILARRLDERGTVDTDASDEPSARENP